MRELRKLKEFLRLQKFQERIVFFSLGAKDGEEELPMFLDSYMDSRLMVISISQHASDLLDVIEYDWRKVEHGYYSEKYHFHFFPFKIDPGEFLREGKCALNEFITESERGECFVLYFNYFSNVVPELENDYIQNYPASELRTIVPVELVLNPEGLSLIVE